MKLKRYTLVCKRRGCDVRIRCTAHVIPSEGWHEHDNLGRPEQHSMKVEVDQKTEDE